MDVNNIGIGAFISAILVVSTNIVLHWYNRQYDLSKEQLIHLYNPLNALIEKKYKELKFLNMGNEDFEHYAIAYYQFFLEFQEVYLTNEVYSSLRLYRTFHSLKVDHRRENAIAFQKSENQEETLRNLALFQMKVGTKVDGHSEFEEKFEEVIKIVQDDLYQIYNQKPVYRFFRNSFFSR